MEALNSKSAIFASIIQELRLMLGKVLVVPGRENCLVLERIIKPMCATSRLEKNYAKNFLKRNFSTLARQK